MYKMMIVDDQLKEIRAIRKILDWGQLGIEIVGDARNGKLGVEEALKLKPDIIITDVVMHGMDGIEMVHEIMGFLPSVKVIFVSCFDDFKFVNQAINQRAYGYVLKPILSRELLNAVNKILGICEEEKKNLELMGQKQKINASISILKENFYKNLIYGIFEDQRDIISQGNFLGIDFPGKKYCVAYIELEGHEGEKSCFQAVSVIGKLKQTFRDQLQMFFILMDLVHIAIMFAENSDNAAKAKKSFLQKTQEVLDYINSTHPMIATAGIGCVTENLKEISLSYKQALKALQYKFYLGKFQVIDTDEVNFQFNDYDINFDGLVDTLKKIMFSRDMKLAEAFVNSTLNPTIRPHMLKYTSYSMLNAIQLILLQMQHNLENILGTYGLLIEQITEKSNLEDLRDWMLNNIAYIIQYIENNDKAEYKDIAKKMEDFIQQNYHHQIMVQDVAEHVYKSPSYANYIFKNVLGKTVHQYMEDLRLEKAINLLLSDKEIKVFKIAEMVGYCNSSYFINVFKKIHGCTPSEYRKRSIR